MRGREEMGERMRGSEREGGDGEGMRGSEREEGDGRGDERK